MPLPSQVSGKVGIFDRFSSRVSNYVSRAWFFSFCVLLIVLWVISDLILDSDYWHQLINTVNAVISLILLALLHNSQARTNKAVDHKLNAMSLGLADLVWLKIILDYDDLTLKETEKLLVTYQELVKSVGLEDKEKS